MNFGKSFLKRTPLNLSHIYKSTEIEPLQFSILMSKYTKSGIIQVPHSYSNKYNNIKMRNTLELVYELCRRNK